MRPIHKKLILMTSDPRSAMMHMYKHSIRIICIYIIVYIIKGSLVEKLPSYGDLKMQ